MPLALCSLLPIQVHVEVIGIGQLRMPGAIGVHDEDFGISLSAIGGRESDLRSVWTPASIFGFGHAQVHHAGLIEVYGADIIADEEEKLTAIW